MQRMMISMNIASNGQAQEPESLVKLRCRVRDLRVSPEAALDIHRQLWRLSGFDTYQFTLSQRSALTSADIRVRVANGEVLSAHELGTGRPYPIHDVGTVDEYFEWIAVELRRTPNNLRALYHPLYGYPLSFTLAESYSGQAQQRQLA